MYLLSRDNYLGLYSNDSRPGRNQTSVREGDEEFDTIGGLIAHEMGHVPVRGEVHELGGLRFEVMHTRGGAVKWFRVSPSNTAT